MWVGIFLFDEKIRRGKSTVALSFKQQFLRIKGCIIREVLFVRFKWHSLFSLVTIREKHLCHWQPTFFIISSCPQVFFARLFVSANRKTHERTHRDTIFRLSCFPLFLDDECASACFVNDAVAHNILRHYADWRWSYFLHWKIDRHQL